jgi:hypothetical protein
MKISILAFTSLLLFSLFACNTVSSKDVFALSINFGGPNGFNFETDGSSTGPQGEKGDKGDTGAQGLQGEKGDKGDTGAQGLQGEKGDKGDTGKQGEPGTPAVNNDLSIRTVEGNVARDGTCINQCSDTEKSVASCNSDEVLTGGGFHKSGNAWTTDSKPVGNSWEAKGNPQSSQNPSTTQAYAQCQKLVPEPQ